MRYDRNGDQIKTNLNTTKEDCVQAFLVLKRASKILCIQINRKWQIAKE